MSTPRIAIIGGGLSGLTLAYELTRRGNGASFTLFERAGRLGGIIETVHHDGFLIECGPDAWVTEKPWARDLACELGLAEELLPSNDATRRTYILQRGRLVPMPDGMRLMVPTDLDAACRSPLFTPSALTAFQREIARAAELQAAAPDHDESIASFVERHFGPEVLHTVAAPLLSGVFGGDVRRLSARAVLPTLVALERRHGSLILGLQQPAARTPDPAGSALATALLPTGEGRDPHTPAIFTTLRHGLGGLIHALAARIPAAAIRLHTPVRSLRQEQSQWVVGLAHANRRDEPRRATRSSEPPDEEIFDAVVLATPIDTTRSLLAAVEPGAAALLPAHASSAITIAFCWSDARLSLRERRRTANQVFAPPPGFGFLVPPRSGPSGAFGPQILAATFADQKFSGRAPTGGRLIRAFFGGAGAERLWHLPDDRLSARALAELKGLIRPLPEASPSTVFRRWHHSLPQYEVGHVERADALDQRLRSRPGLHLLGNALRGVGLPDLVRDARALAPRLFS